jgi:uncharacterized protein YbjT (DUF2867 family)
MKIAITGGTGFVGRHLVRALLWDRHEVVIVARGVDKRDTPILGAGATFVAASTDDADSLRRAFTGCDSVAHFAGINRELGAQTYERVHVRGTRAVVDAARTAGVRRIVYLSFLRARPDCGSAYHESKWAAEEIVRATGLEYTILKSGVIYGRGDHLLDHVSRALYTFPFFPLVGCGRRDCARSSSTTSCGSPKPRSSTIGFRGGRSQFSARRSWAPATRSGGSPPLSGALFRSSPRRCSCTGSSVGSSRER